jgi:hypothetical protein
MQTDACFHRDDPRSTSTVSTTDHNDSFQVMSGAELKLMQEITLHQMRETKGEAQLLLLGRVWYRLEQERRRRNAEIAELEGMYFAR